MRKLLGKVFRWPFRRRREERRLLETDPALSVERARPGAVETRGCSWAAGASDRGRSRANNEDDFLISPERRLFIVCDGMGGHAAGEVASEEAIEALDAALTAEGLAETLAGGGKRVEDLLRTALQQANERVVALGQENASWSGMASTAVIAVLDGNTLHVSNLGDSRAYLVRGQRAQALTTDHSVAAALAEQGQIAPKEVRSHPLRNHLTASLGIPQPVMPAYTCVEVKAGDRVLLCSDGLWDMLSDAEIARMVAAHSDPHEAAKALIAAANAAGGPDNITVIVALVGGEETGAQEQVTTDTIAQTAAPGLTTQASLACTESVEQERNA